MHALLPLAWLALVTPVDDLDELARPAATEDRDVADGVDDEEKGEPDNGVSARVLFGGVHAGGDELPLVGVGVAYERDFFDQLIAVELALEGLTSPRAQALLAEIVVEKPIELGESFGVYLGFGPTAGLHVEGAKTDFAVGGLALFGGEVVVSGGLELFVELDSAVLFVDGAPVLEADVGTGVLYRF